MQSIWLIIVVFFLTLLVIPVFAKVYFSFDVLGNLGAISVYVYCFKIIAYKLRFKGKELVVFTSSKDEKEIEIEVSEKQLRFLKQFTIQLKQKVIIKNINFISRIGFADHMYTSLGTGLFNIFVTSAMGYLKTQKKSLSYQITNHPNYKDESLTISLQATFFITLFDILYAIIMSFIIVRRSEKYERA